MLKTPDAPNNTQPRYSLIKNPNIESLTDAVSKTTAKWPRIIERFNQLVNNKFDPSNLPGLLSEIHLGLTLSDLTEQFPGLRLNPIPFGERNERFTFRKGRLGSYEVLDNTAGYSKAGKRRTGFVEFDQLVELNGIPVVWEVKMADPKSYHRGFEALSQKRIIRLADSLHSYYGHRQLACIVLLPNQIAQRTASNNLKFLQIGGMITPFYATKDQFQQEIDDIFSKLATSKEDYT